MTEYAECFEQMTPKSFRDAKEDLLKVLDNHRVARHPRLSPDYAWAMLRGIAILETHTAKLMPSQESQRGQAQGLAKSVEHAQRRYQDEPVSAIEGITKIISDIDDKSLLMADLWEALPAEPALPSDGFLDRYKRAVEGIVKKHSRRGRPKGRSLSLGALTSLARLYHDATGRDPTARMEQRYFLEFLREFCDNLRLGRGRDGGIAELRKLWVPARSLYREQAAIGVSTLAGSPPAG